MNRMLVKIMVVFIIIGISVPVIVVAANNQDDILTFFVNKKSESKTDPSTFMNNIDDIELDKVTDIKTMPDSDFNIFGKWGIYDSTDEGAFKGLEEKDAIYGKAWYNNHKVYFYIQLNKYVHTFKGIIIFNDNFYDLNGNYLKKDGKFIAMWYTEIIEGWIAGEII